MRASMAAIGVLALFLLSACDMFATSETRIERAREAFSTGDYGRAEIELLNVLQDEPQNSVALTQLIETLMFQSNFVAADRQATALRKLAPLSSEAADLIARLYIEKQDFAGLKAALAAGELPLGETRSLREAQLLLAEGKTPEAIKLLTTIIETRPTDVEARTIYAMVLTLTGNSSEAAAQLDAALATVPEYARAWAMKARIALNDNPLEALQNLDKALQHAGGQLSRLEQAGLLSMTAGQQLAVGNTAAAEAAANKLSVLLPGSPLAVQVAAEISYAKGEFGAAVSALQGLLAKQPGYHLARLLLGKALAAQGSLPWAESTLAELVSKTPDDPEPRKALAGVALKLNDPVKALQVLAPVMDGVVDQESANLISEAQTMAANSSKDRDRLAGLVKSDPGNESLRLLTAGVLSRAGEHQAVIDMLGRSREFDVRGIPLLLNSVAATRGGSALRSEAERLAAAMPDNLGVPTALGVFFAGRNDFAAARTWFERALNQADRTADTKQRNTKLNLIKLLAGAYARLGDRTAALAVVKRYPTAGAGDIVPLLLEADVKMELKDYGGAAAAYQQAFDTAPTSQGVVKLAQARVYAGMPDAAAPLQLWLSKHPADNGARMLLAEIHQNAGQRDQAVSAYEAVLALQPSHVRALNNLAWLYFELQDKRALDLARQAYEKSDRVPAIADTYGWILLKVNRVQDSLPILAEAAANSTVPEIQYHYAVALAATGSMDEARARLSALLKEAGQFSVRAEAERTLAEWNGRS